MRLGKRLFFSSIVYCSISLVVTMWFGAMRGNCPEEIATPQLAKEQHLHLHPCVFQPSTFISPENNIHGDQDMSGPPCRHSLRPLMIRGLSLVHLPPRPTLLLDRPPYRFKMIQKGSRPPSPDYAVPDPCQGTFSHSYKAPARQHSNQISSVLP